MILWKRCGVCKEKKNLNGIFSNNLDFVQAWTILRETTWYTILIKLIFGSQIHVHVDQSGYKEGKKYIVD